MVKVYETFGPILMKLESLVLHTNAGKSTYMTNYYTFWENKIYVSLIKMTLNNLERLEKNIAKENLMYQVDGILAPPDIMMRPSPTEIFNIILKSVKDFLDKLKLFPRWMNETCLLCEPQHYLNSHETFTFSFYEDVVQVNIYFFYIQNY